MNRATQTIQGPDQDNARTSDRFETFIGVSVAAHVVAVALFTVRAVFYPSEPIQLERSIRVDIVALPDKKAATLPAPAPAPEPKVEAKPEPAPAPEPVAAKPELPKPAPVQVAKPEAPKVNLNKTKQDQEAALKRLEALERLQKQVKQESGQQAAKPAAAAASASTAPASSAPIKGNEVSAGSSLKGIARLEHQSYLENIDTSIKRHWNLPQWLRGASLSAKVRLFVDANGNVVKKVMTVASRESVFNERVMQAIESASPLPRPPSSLVNLMAVDGIELEFVPE